LCNLPRGDGCARCAPRFEGVDDGVQQLERLARQVQVSVRLELLVGDWAIVHLQDGAVARVPIAPEQAQHLHRADLRQVVPEQKDLWLSALSEA
jgi:hypothetical protein